METSQPDAPAPSARPPSEPANRNSSTDAGDSDASRVRWAFLAEASRCLADSLEYEATLETVAGLALPLLGSWSIVDLTEPNGSVRRLAIVHPDPQKQAIARELKAGWPPRREDAMGVSRVAQTGKSELLTEITDEFLVSTVTVECGMDGQPTIRVIDTGCGIPEEKRESVFEPFVQANSTLTRPTAGMGLGLSISRQLARDMAGDLTVTSARDEGCTFILTLQPVQQS